MIRRPPRSTQSRSSAASDVYKRQIRQQNITDSTDRIVTANHEVTENTADQYACHVRLPDGTAIMQRFNITGMLADICTVSVFTLIMGLDAC